MKRVEGRGESFFSLSKSSTDSNRLYSILLDAKVSAQSQNIHQTVETLLSSEKDNAKKALENLWILKNNMHTTNSETSTLDMLIRFYQNKIDILRTKEENIRKISKDSRELLEEKKKRDCEIASIKQQIEDGTRELEALTAKIEKLKIKEQELLLIENELKKELIKNENEVINGLYEIIMPSDFQEFEQQQPLSKVDENKYDDTKNETDRLGNSKEKDSTEPIEIKQESIEPANIEFNEATRIDIEVVSGEGNDSQNQKEADIAVMSTITEKSAESASTLELYKKVEPPEKPIFPKSVVKTTKGKIIGEYYYDPNVYKNKRHYVFNSNFFSDQLKISIDILTQNFDQTVYSEMLQMIQDAYNRIQENPNIHYEISTNEILNEKTLQTLCLLAKEKKYTDIKQFCNRLSAKLDMLGRNYFSMLKEQFQRYSQT